MELNANSIDQLEHCRRGSDETALKLEFFNTGVVSVAPNVFDKFRSLQKLNLQWNSIAKIPKLLFGKLPELREIYLGGNKIGSIDFDVFSGNKKLQKIDLKENEIDEIHPNTFINLPQLLELYLGSNKLRTFVFEALHTSPELKHLEINDNYLTEISEFENFRRNFPKLSLVRLEGNNFSCDYMQKVLKCLEQQRIRVWGSDKSRGIQEDTVYGIKCAPVVSFDDIALD